MSHSDVSDPNVWRDPHPPDNERQPDVPRWTLNRAGIVNVYQYGDETLHFGGGRLLLRGVNGSGKSTAMNMLLPFLLDGDTRRIDAAGEQSGVLRAWMLSGRDEPQPQGYLWIELAKGDEYLSFGCGIRANQSTDRVITWWFITSRRPGIDLKLVEGRVPIDLETLRGAIAPDPIYRHHQRDGYRTELRNRLFGGADLEQHLYLLRIVRNPRVGDRLDAELPQYLEDALPQLSDTALDDAAQPLEDLEEHRRNVAALQGTATALAAIQEVYGQYARTELYRIGSETIERVNSRDRLQRAEVRAREARDNAARRQAAATADKARQAASVERLRTEIAAIETSDAYKSGAQLNDLRNHVDALGDSVGDAEAALERRLDAVARARDGVAGAQRDVDSEWDEMRGRLSALSSLASAAQLTARPPAAPPLATETAGDVTVPVRPIDATAADQQLVRLRAAAQHRRGDVQAVEEAVQAITPAEQALQQAERALADAQAVHVDARTALDAARQTFQSAITDWRGAALRWHEALQQHHDGHGFGAVATPVAIDDPATAVVSGHSLVEPLQALVDPALAHHQRRRAQAEAALAQCNAEVDELEARVAALAARRLPEPPAQDWQRREGRRCLAELVDFRDDVEPAARAGLEAAMEAAGLLGAQVHRGGELQLADGELLAAADAETVAPLAALLRVDLPADHDGPETADDVARILRGISTDPDSSAHTVVTRGGVFRLGALSGRHHKPAAEHIGIAARRAALERQRAAAQAALEQARSGRERAAAAVDAARAALDEARRLRAAVPSQQDAVRAHAQREQAAHLADNAAQTLAQRQDEQRVAEQQCTDTVERAQRAATRFSLPLALPELAAIRRDLDHVVAGCGDVQRELVRLDAAVQRWTARADDWRAATADFDAAQDHLQNARSKLDSARARLDTLEKTIGEAYAEVVATLASRRDQLGVARNALEQADTPLQQAYAHAAKTAEQYRVATDDREQADMRCVAALPALRAALAVPGLVAAALDVPQETEAQRSPAHPAARDGNRDTNGRYPGGVRPDASDDNGVSNGAPVAAGSQAVARAGAAAQPEARTAQLELPAVDETPDGARRLAGAVLTCIPQARDKTTAESVRASLRRRRDRLGAGWDAEDHQPDPELPLHVEVTGPLAPQVPQVPLPQATAAVRTQLATMSGLLTAKQDQALRNLLQGLIAREVAEKLHAAGELIVRMNRRLRAITTTHGIGVTLRWRRRDDLDPSLAEIIALLAKPPDLRTAAEDRALSDALGQRIHDARRDEPELPYRELIARVLDYRVWHRMDVLLQRPGRVDERLTRRTALSEGEKKIVSYLPLFAAVAASCDALAAQAPHAPRFVLLDDAFAKVSEDNHAKLFGLLVELDLDFIATSERLWGTHDTVPALAITEVIRDADLRTIVLEHSRWDGKSRASA